MQPSVGQGWRQPGQRLGQGLRRLQGPSTSQTRGHGAGRADHNPGSLCPRPPVLPSWPSSEAPSSRKLSQTTRPRGPPILWPSQPDGHILAGEGARVGRPHTSSPPVSGRACRASQQGGSGRGVFCGWERPGAAGFTPWSTRLGDESAGPLTQLRTIQKRVPVARATYCSMVDSTLKMRQTRTMRKLRDRRTRSQRPRQDALPSPLRRGPGPGSRPCPPRV